MAERLKVCATLASFNRRKQTCDALRAFFAQVGDFRLSAVLMDDGSTDGTGEAVREVFPEVTVLRGDGSLFWNRGMAAAYDVARGGDADFLLWLNDDTELDSDALLRLVRDASRVMNENGAILVGSTRDPDTGELTYGGVLSASRWHPGKFAIQRPGQTPMPCHAMNGNIVLISKRASEILGGIDTRFSHSMGDYDYALRAHAADVPAYVGAGYHGSCARNPTGSAWHEKAGPLARFRAVNSPKGLPMREWAYFLRKHGGVLWPLAWFSTYRRLLTG